MYGEQTPPAPPAQEYIPEAVLPKPKEEDNRQFVVFKLVNSSRKGGVHIPGQDHVIDPRGITKDNPQGNGPEMIRLISGVTTIWAKEQKDISPDYIKKNVRTIHFPRGTKFITIPTWDKAALEFMKVCRHNIENPNRISGSKLEFFEYDPKKAAMAQYKKELLELEMITKAKDCPEADMKKHAAFLGIAFVDEIGRLKEETMLRTEYMLAAKRDPQTFEKTFGSKQVDIQYKVRAAILDSKIDIGRGDGKVYWGKGGGLICNIPKSEQPLKFLTDLALTPNDEGKQFLERLNEIST